MNVCTRTMSSMLETRYHISVRIIGVSSSMEKRFRSIFYNTSSCIITYTYYYTYNCTYHYTNYCTYYYTYY